MATSHRALGDNGLVFGSRTDIGSVREHNEDSLIVAPPLFVVADGMGGHAAGEIASEIAVNIIAQRAPLTLDSEALAQAVKEANIAIIQAAHQGVGREGMGTTCTAAMLEGERLIIAQVGDSRAYLLHRGRLQQLTRDHSLMADLIEAGRITPEEARVHPQRSAITRALGSDPHTQPDIYEINVEAGDRLLICSDGLSSMLEDQEIEGIMRRTKDPQLCAAQLVNAAIGAGGYDNVTVIVVNVPGFAEKNRRRIARKTKVFAVSLIVLLAIILGVAVYAFNSWTTNSAYLVDQDGMVAVYRGVQGEFLGMSFSELDHVTDIPVDDLQPGTANRLRNGGIACSSMEEIEQLLADYEKQVDEAEGKDTDGSSGSGGASSKTKAGGADTDSDSTGASATPQAGNTRTTS